MTVVDVDVAETVEAVGAARVPQVIVTVVVVVVVGGRGYVDVAGGCSRDRAEPVDLS